jgi:hypothetical protein
VVDDLFEFHFLLLSSGPLERYSYTEFASLHFQFEGSESQFFASRTEYKRSEISDRLSYSGVTELISLLREELSYFVFCSYSRHILEWRPSRLNIATYHSK